MPEDRLILTYGDADLRQSDMDSLKPRQWIKDNVISFWFEYLQSKYKDVIFLGPNTVQLIKELYRMKNSHAIREMMAQIGIKELGDQVVLMPVNDAVGSSSGSHWSLLVISKGTPSLLHYDSTSSANENAARQLFRGLCDAFDAPDYKLIRAVSSQQENSYDCGIHVMCNADFICQQEKDPNNSDYETIAGTESVSKMRKTLVDLVQKLAQKKDHNN